jgi:hypothetical protein
MKRTSIAEAAGTSLQGYIRTTYRDLVKFFGEPIQHYGGKTNVEWILKSDDGQVITIYDWKVPRYAWSDNQIFEFNVGGKSEKVLDALFAFFAQKEEKA